MSRRPGGAAILLALIGCLLLPAFADAAPAPAKEAKAADRPPQLQSRSWGVIDARSGDVLTSHGLNKSLPIASTTKLMTAYVAMKDMPLDKIVRAAPYEAEYGESLMGLRAGQRISVRDLLYGLILLSGNDAAHTLAIAAAGSQERFVAQMNRYAAALGLSHTHYANPIGLDEKGNYSSAGDLMTLTRRLLAEPAFARIADARSAVLRSVHPRRRIESINELLQMAPWVTGVKTGHTFGALYVLVGSGQKHGISLISTVVGAWTDEERFDGNLALLEWGFSQYRRKLPIRRGQDLADPEIRYSGGRLPLRAEKSLAVGVRRGQGLEVRVAAPHAVEGPLRRGAKLGRASVFVEGRKVGSVSLRAGRSVEKASAFDRARAFFADNWIPIAVGMFVILMIALILRYRVVRRKEARREVW
ncbi:MAG TPA: D-alanyl-D-alanine carboxypeptidase family protein [Solirubrobacterales bacterium]|nr:D-alanyl-D-alanine carboxypeptidase family protein [Solirubrobacterales bacterium]